MAQAPGLVLGRVADASGGAEVAVGDAEPDGSAHGLEPHSPEAALLIGDAGDVPKVSCPLHKKNVSLETGECLSGDDFRLETVPVKVEAPRPDSVTRGFPTSGVDYANHA